MKCLPPSVAFRCMAMHACGVLLALLGAGNAGGAAEVEAARTPLPAAVADGPVQGRAPAFPLAFALPPVAELRASRHRVFAHYFTQFPRSFDNRPEATDYYTAQYLQPEGERGKFVAQGGFLRQRPLARPVSAAADWAAQDLRWEVRTAAAAGIDGFCLDLLQTSGAHWQRAQALLAAADAVPGFTIVLMPDLTATFATPRELVEALATLGAAPSACRLADGRLVVAPYCAQERDEAWWDEVAAGCRARGLAIALFPVLQHTEQHRERFAARSVGLSEWGVRTPDGVTGRPQLAAWARQRGLLWMEPVAPQDMRPKDLQAFEARNTTLFRTAWERAIGQDADWVQLVTWNDYSESSAIAPSSGTGWLFMELTAWYATRYKTGSWPVVTRDTAWLVHRRQSSALVPARQERPFRFRDGGPLDEVEALVFLTAPAEVRLTSGTARVVERLPAGLGRISAPLAIGRPQVQVVRDGRTVLAGDSAWPVTPLADYQDLLYRATPVVGDEP